jgi:tol-pal system protein YbgF
MKQYTPWILVALLCLLVGASSPASGEKELIIRLQGEVLVLQRQLRDLQEAFDKAQGQSTAILQRMAESSESSQRTLASFEDAFKSTQNTQVNNLAGTNVRLTKIIDQLSTNEQKFNQVGQQINSLRQMVEQYQRRLENEKAAEKERAEKQAEAVPTISSPDQLYSFAYNLYSQGRYEQAIANFRRYLDGYGQTEAADNALFWVAESLNALGKTGEALREYERLLAEYPRSDKAASTQFKKGILLLQLERREEGVNTLRVVIAQYPASPEATQATQELTRLGESLTAPVQPSAKNNVRTRSSRINP